MNFFGFTTENTEVTEDFSINIKARQDSVRGSSQVEPGA